ncbi:hypothetical protein K502DRAFT_103120 [Neoconidiobolus thromboides FSU 785]|nr:hypothetical protein K502DRAFT_103120 [Neoconidiobolus thromboides FSU 785]
MGVFFLTSLFFPFFKRYVSGKFVSKILKHKNTSPYINSSNRKQSTIIYWTKTNVNIYIFYVLG